MMCLLLSVFDMNLSLFYLNLISDLCKWKYEAYDRDDVEKNNEKYYKIKYKLNTLQHKVCNYI